MTVKLFEIRTEWMYSNPTGIFNLSILDKEIRTGGGFNSMNW